MSDNIKVSLAEYLRKKNLDPQYAARYLEGLGSDYPKLGGGLQYTGDQDSPERVQMTEKDAEEFVKRVREYTEQNNPWLKISRK
jgi:hypothetical protein